MGMITDEESIGRAAQTAEDEPGLLGGAAGGIPPNDKLFGKRPLQSLHLAGFQNRPALRPFH